MNVSQEKQTKATNMLVNNHLNKAIDALESIKTTQVDYYTKRTVDEAIIQLKALKKG